MSRRLETEKEKVLPFYESTIDEEEIPEDLRKVFGGKIFLLIFFYFEKPVFRKIIIYELYINYHFI